MFCSLKQSISNSLLYLCKNATYYWIMLLSFPSNSSLVEKPGPCETTEMRVTVKSCYKNILLSDIPVTYWSIMQLYCATTALMRCDQSLGVIDYEYVLLKFQGRMILTSYCILPAVLNSRNETNLNDLSIAN